MARTSVMYTGKRTITARHVSTTYHTAFFHEACVESTAIVNPPFEQHELQEAHDQRDTEQADGHHRAGSLTQRILAVEDLPHECLGGTRRSAAREDVDLREGLEPED